MELSLLNELKPKESKIRIEKIQPLTGSIYLVQCSVVNPQVAFNGNLSGKYIKLNLPIGERSYSIEAASEGDKFNLIIGGSSLNANELEFLEYCKFCVKNYDGYLDKTTYSVEGRCYLRKTVKHNKLFIAAGTGFSFIRPLLVSALEFYADNKENDILSGINVDLIWGNRTISNVYCQLDFKTLVKQDLPNLNFDYSLLVDKKFDYHKQIIDIFNPNIIIEESSLLNYLKNNYIPKMKERGLDLSNTIIYVGSSYDAYKSITELLIKELNADPLLIVCDHQNR